MHDTVAQEFNPDLLEADTQAFWYVSENGIIPVKQDSDFIATAILISGNPTDVDWDVFTMNSPSMKKDFTHGGPDGIPLDGLSPGGIPGEAETVNVNYWYKFPVQEFLPRGTVLRPVIVPDDVDDVVTVVTLFGFKLFPRPRMKNLPAARIPAPAAPVSGVRR